MNSLVVVCRYSESKLSWIDKVNKNVLLYNKGNDNISQTNNQKVINIPNIGFEEYAYLKYIIDYYDNLADTVYFTQADPFTHSPDFLRLVNLPTYDIENIQPLSLQWGGASPGDHFIKTTKNLWIQSGKIFVTFYNAKLERYYLPLDKFIYSNIFNGVYRFFIDYYFKKDVDVRKNIFDILQIKPRSFGNKHMTPMCPGAIFSVSKEIIQKHSKQYYEYLLNQSIEISKINPKLFAIMMEFAWLELFGYNPPEELYKNENFETNNKEGLCQLET